MVGKATLFRFRAPGNNTRAAPLRGLELPTAPSARWAEAAGAPTSEFA